MAKTPYRQGFIFDVEKWFGSVGSTRMSFAEKGVYLVMLFQQWRDTARTLPDDANGVADLIAITEAQRAEVLGAWDVVRRKFDVDRRASNRIFNAALERTRRAQHASWLKKVKAGQLGGERSASKRQQTRPQVMQHRLSTAQHRSTDLNRSDLNSTKNLSLTPSVPEGAACTYCGAMASQLGRAMQWDHFVPRAAGGSDDPSNLVLACYRCNQAKQDRIFETIDEARMWLHRAYWSSKRKRWIDHRAIAFGGQPPANIAVYSADWVCPHVEPTCTSQWKCKMRADIEAARKAAAS